MQTFVKDNILYLNFFLQFFDQSMHRLEGLGLVKLRNMVI